MIADTPAKSPAGQATIIFSIALQITRG